MKKTILVTMLAMAFLLAIPLETQAAPEFHLYFVDAFNTPSGARVAEHFCNVKAGYVTDCIFTPITTMDYGFLPTFLVAAAQIDSADHAALILNADVFGFPANLDQPVNDPTIDARLEALYLPTDWLTPSTTYRELLRRLAGMLQFNQRYGGTICPGQSFLGGGVGLDTKWNALGVEQQACFNATLESFGFPSGVAGNPNLRTLIKRGGDLWDGVPFYLGSFEF